MKLDELIEEEMYVLVAPDGSAQISTLAPEYAMCVAFAELLASKGIGQKPSAMLKKGFEILRVQVTIKQMGDAEAAFAAAKKKWG